MPVHARDWINTHLKNVFFFAICFLKSENKQTKNINPQIVQYQNESVEDPQHRERNLGGGGGGKGGSNKIHATASFKEPGQF